jgi:hypothetical protein
VLDQLEGYMSSLNAIGAPGFHRMKSKIVLDKRLFGRPFFEVCDDFSASNHFETISVAKTIEGENTHEKSEEALGLLCGKLLAEANEWEKLPPWKMYLITDVLNAEGKVGCAIFWKLHHALADGMFVSSLINFKSHTLSFQQQPTTHTTTDHLPHTTCNKN